MSDLGYSLTDIILEKKDTWGKERTRRFLEVFLESLKIAYSNNLETSVETSGDYVPKDKKNLELTMQHVNLYEMQVCDYNATYGEGAYQKDEEEVRAHIEGKEPELEKALKVRDEILALGKELSSIEHLLSTAKHLRARMQFKLEEDPDRYYL